jgi:hypothetical protein
MRRTLKWIAVGAVTLLVLATALLLALPLLLDSEAVRAAALQQLSRATGGQWQLSHLRLRWLPAPTISAADASFSIPDTIEVKAESLTLTTALLPLLWGEIRLSQAALVAPDLTVKVAPSPASGPGRFTVSDLRAALAGISRSSTVDLRLLEIAVERGRVVLAAPDRAGLTLSEISGRATQRAGRFEVEVTSAASVARRLQAKVSLDPERFDGSLQLDAQGVDVAALLAMAGASGPPQLQGLISGHTKVQVSDAPALRGPFTATSSALAISSRGGKLDVRDLAISGDVEWTDAGLRVAARDVRAAAPALVGAAALTFNPDWNKQRLDVKVQPTGLDIVKQVVLPWMADAPVVEQYARMIMAGQLSGLEATLQLDQIAQWRQAIEARGTVAGLALALTRPQLSIRDLGASLVLTQGKLTAQSVRAAAGRSAIDNGRITVDFTTAQTGLSATAQWQIDLAEALTFTKRQLASGQRESLEALRTVAGNARGTVSLSGTFDKLRVLAEADTIRGETSLEPLPWPINVTGARARFDGSGLVVQEVTGTVGASGFSRCSGEVALVAPARLQVSRCDADLALVELFEWASKQWKQPEALQGLRVLGGRGVVTVHRVAGPLERPSAWSADISATPQAVRLSHPEVPGELRLDGGSVRSDLASVTAQGVKAQALDAAVQVSGVVSGLREGTPRLDTQVTGPVGERILAWGWDRAGLPRGAERIAPFEARGARLRWPVNQGVETGGDLVFAGKTTVSFDALTQPGSLEIRKLAIQDEQSNARLAIHRRQDVVDGSFTGTVAGASLDRIVASKQWPETRVAGNLTYRIPLRQPRDFRANGQLRVSRLTSLGWTVRNADIKAVDRTLQLATSLSALDTNVDVSGTIRGTDQRYALDIDVKSDSVDLKRLLAAFDQGEGQRSEEQATSWDFPVEGKVRLAIRSLRYGSRHIEPLRAALDIAPGHVDVAVREARLCGVEMTGGGRAEPERLGVDVVLRARDIDAQPTVLCLTNETTAVTGRLHADARLTGVGPYRKLFQHIQGPFQVTSRKGRVDRMTTLADILNLVNASELLRGKKLDLTGSGFTYDRLELKGTLGAGTIQFDELVLDAQPFDLVARGDVDWLNDSVDMNVAVAPLQAVNTIVKRVPFLGYVLGGGVYAIPVGVRGKLSDPQIVPVAPAAVAGELLGVLERTLKTPFNLREALLPPARPDESAAPPPTPAPQSDPRPGR